MQAAETERNMDNLGRAAGDLKGNTHQALLVYWGEGLDLGNNKIKEMPNPHAARVEFASSCKKLEAKCPECMLLLICPCCDPVSRL